MAASDRPSVLLVEDEASQREILTYNLESDGYEVRTATDGEEALLMVSEAVPDLILLDWMLPHVSGLEVCRRLRQRPETRSVPIVMISARSEEVDRVRGLETGADDYMVKPYSVAELMARLKAHLRRARPSVAGGVLEWGDIRLDAETHRVTRGEKPAEARPHRIPPAGHADGASRPGLQPRAIARPGLGARHLRRHTHGRCPHRPAAQGADGPWR